MRSLQLDSPLESEMVPCKIFPGCKFKNKRQSMSRMDAVSICISLIYIFCYSGLLTFTARSRIICPRSPIANLPWNLVIKWTALFTLNSTSVPLTLTSTQACCLVKWTMCPICMSFTVTPTSHLYLSHRVVVLRN